MLSQIFDKEKTKSIIDVMPDSMIVWKVVTDWRFITIGWDLEKRGMKKNCWHPAFAFGRDSENLIWYPFRRGCNENKVWGFHCFVKKNEVEQYKRYFKNRSQIGSWNMLSARIEKKDIMKIGLDRGLSLTILTSRIILPTYPNTDITKKFTENCDRVEDCEQAMELMLDDSSLVEIHTG